MKSNQSFYFEGNDKAVLLLHSFTSTTIDVRTLGRALNQHGGYTVYGPLLTNHGEEIEHTLDIPVEEWFKDGERGVKFLQDKGFQNIVSIGNSLGGIISMCLLTSNPNIRAAGTLCSPMIPGYKTTTPLTFWRRFVEEKRKLGWSEDRIDFKFDDIMLPVFKVFEQLDNIKKDLMLEYPKITKPVLIAQGANDKTIDPAQAFVFKKLLNNSPVTFKWYDRGGHVLPIGEYRKEIMKDILIFLEQVFGMEP